jgi:hypothetical protein
MIWEKYPVLFGQEMWGGAGMVAAVKKEDPVRVERVTYAAHRLVFVLTVLS